MVGLMPHPERASSPLLGSEDGLGPPARVGRRRRRRVLPPDRHRADTTSPRQPPYGVSHHAVHRPPAWPYSSSVWPLPSSGQSAAAAGHACRGAGTAGARARGVTRGASRSTPSSSSRGRAWSTRPLPVTATSRSSSTRGTVGSTPGGSGRTRTATRSTKRTRPCRSSWTPWRCCGVRASPWWCRAPRPRR